ncbi:PaaI family thioesterase [Novosphingobium olei]|uniref:PaaI family thioesterase n=1 Tax=Novosphingobium olei TaxID=2728851 RepID=A0A7Y0GAX1_9SPHN|nr:PaaI family thioesterase [Novosphingobium olei]NML95510.1 PaaI family thioesterase [Novosphingobium olei]BEU99133.1 PaaI family thioesterase [Novosphingobium olei]
MTDGAAQPEAGWKRVRFGTPFLDQSGPYFVPEADGVRGLAMRVTAPHVNYVSAAHGGVLATFADVALSYQVFLLEEGGLPITTVSMAVNYLAPAKLGDWLTSEVRIDRLGARIAHTSGRLLRGETTLMTMTGVYNLLRPLAGAGKG